MDTKTPETDAFHQEILAGPLHAVGARYREFSRQLERQRDEAREAKKHREYQLRKKMDECAALIVERDSLRVALADLVNCPITSGSSAHYRDWHKQRGLPDVLEAARRALALKT